MRAWVAIAAALALIGALPWLVAIAGADDAARWLYHNLCHQEPARTLAWQGSLMVVCSRCAGVHLGLVAGALSALPQRWLGWGRALVMLAVAANVVEWAINALGAPLSHGARLACGAAFGWAATAFFVASLRFTAARRLASSRT